MKDPAARLIGIYLDGLRCCLGRPSEQVDRLVTEAEAHLSESVAVKQTAGRDALAATAEAIEEFGSIPQVAAAANRAGPAAALRAVTGILVRIAATGLVLAGLTGLTARAAAALTSVQAVFGLPSDVRMPAAMCTRWVGLHPETATCQQAATAEAAQDLTLLAGLAGLIGLLTWAVILLARARSSRSRGYRRGLPAPVEPSVTMALFAAIAAGAAVLGASDAVVFTTWGAGLWWSAAGCALIIAAAAGTRLAWTVRRGHVRPFATHPPLTS